MANSKRIMPRKTPSIDREELDHQVKRLAYQLKVLSGILLALIIILFVIGMVREALGIK